MTRTCLRGTVGMAIPILASLALTLAGAAKEEAPSHPHVPATRARAGVPTPDAVSCPLRTGVAWSSRVLDRAFQSSPRVDQHATWARIV